MMPIPSRIYNAAVGGHVAGADQIIDDKTGLTLDKVAGGALEEKEHISGSNNGMGRVVLRKNIVEGVNTLTQTMINKSNTIYIIQYDFTLGEDITVPENCVLEFDGGSISAGSGVNIKTIACQNTIFKGISNSVVKLTGTYQYDTIDSFGVRPCNSAQENSIAIEAFLSNNPSVLRFGKGIYNFNRPIELKGTNSNISIVGFSKNATKLIFQEDGIRFAGDNGIGSWFNGVDVRDLYIKSENGNCIDLAYLPTSNINNSLFFNIGLESPNKSCFYQTYRHQNAFTNTFLKVTFLYSKYCFDHCSLELNTIVDSCIDIGITYYFHDITAFGQGLVCRNLGVGCNHTIEHFIFIENKNENGDEIISKILLEDCNFEELRSNLIVAYVGSEASDAVYDISMSRCKFNFGTYAPITNYVVNEGIFSKVDYTDANTFYPFVGKLLLPHINNCNFSFYGGSRTNPIYSICTMIPPYWKLGRLNTWIITRDYGANRKCCDKDIIDIAEADFDIQYTDSQWIIGSKTLLYINSSDSPKVFHIGDLNINFTKNTYIKGVQIEKNILPPSISALSTDNIIGFGTPLTGTQITYRDNGKILTYNGTNWVDATGTPI